ncbi:hypothetical protein PR202_ga24620 [Eleusine coracana subsp. coracana]|uniref:Uncharacterized protein n=1 Tax=Eleusine coracana subsp. coracana TaxID=191504 RepID=A0AAV5D914_ELECO|nr:hypothetical protein PR202_ga24620 [Eleusine coracana subsp. coracana]
MGSRPTPRPPASFLSRPSSLSLSLSLARDARYAALFLASTHSRHRRHLLVPARDGAFPGSSSPAWDAQLSPGLTPRLSLPVSRSCLPLPASHLIPNPHPFTMAGAGASGLPPPCAGRPDPPPPTSRRPDPHARRVDLGDKSGEGREAVVGARGE